MDTGQLAESWRFVTSSFGDEVAAHFYAVLFIRHPELRALFPVSMAAQRDRFVAALGHIVAHSGDLDAARPYLEGLGRDHRRFGVAPEHFPLVGRALIETLAHFMGPYWTEELAGQWQAAYAAVAGVMVTAATDAARTGQPARVPARVVDHHVFPGTNIAMIIAEPQEPISYRPGESIPVEAPGLRPRVWRHYSPTTPPTPDNTISFHVRAVADGALSPALVYATMPGTMLNLGPPSGHGLVPTPGTRDVLLLAGGTGLAPLWAVAQHLIHDPQGGWVTLAHVVATDADLYWRDHMDALARNEPRFGVRYVVGGPDHIGPAVDRLDPQRWGAAFVCGPPGMVAACRQRLTAAGTAPDSIHTEEYDPAAPPTPAHKEVIPR